MDEKSVSALRTYKEKRNFSITPEPAEGGVANANKRAFVIQKHWATRLHYDLRLELEGTMKSWAVPKGPSFDPADKRMAVQVEDHPIAYNTFEGMIPAGQYGAGKVIVWDKGTWFPLEDAARGYADGKLKFELRGHKLHGRWTLVRMKSRGDEKKPVWLFIKEKDELVRPASEFSVVDEMPDSVKQLDDRPSTDDLLNKRDQPSPAKTAEKKLATSELQPRKASQLSASQPPPGARPAALPDQLEPQLATLVDGPPPDPENWIYEIKFDGYRMLARVENGSVRLMTRTAKDWTHKLPHLQQALQSMDLPDGWYDGEIVVSGAQEAANFQALQGAFEASRTASIALYLFDLPYCAGHDLREVPLTLRREILQRIVMRKPHQNVRFSDVFEADPHKIVSSACRLGLEGVIGKRRNSAYVTRRSSDWIKLKCARRQEFVVAGFTDPKGARTGFGALLLGVQDKDKGLVYAGNVGTGFNEQSLRELRAQLDALRTGNRPFAAGAQITNGAHWTRPELVAEVSFSEWTRDGRIRQGVFHGLRTDKPPTAIVREEAQHSAPVDKPAQRARNKASKLAAPSANPAGPNALPASLRVTHPERVIDAASGTTKIDLVRYYLLVAPLMMEHLKGRPVSLVRAPDGVGGELFFQKHADHHQMPGIELLDRALDPSHEPLLEVARADGLLSAAQMNVIEFHTWNAVKTSIAKPDRMTFDLDPGEGVQWPQVREAAQLTRTFLIELGLPAFLKTSGGKGLHVVVPLKKQCDWDSVKGFSEAIVQHMARTIPQRFVAKLGPKNRVGKIFIDYLRNGFGATTVCAWSARSRPGLGISVPVGWDELDSLTGGAHWTVSTVHSRLAQGNAPWADYAASPTGLAPAMKMLGFKRKQQKK